MPFAVSNYISIYIEVYINVGIGFGLVDPDRKEHNAEVLACTKRLLENVIPNFAERIKTFDMNSLPKLKALLHSEGKSIVIFRYGSDTLFFTWQALMFDILDSFAPSLETMRYLH